MARSRHDVARSRRDKEKEKSRFYLLPGQGGRAHRRKQWIIMKWSLFVGLVVAGTLAALMYWLNSSKPH
jgi:hypothetical protein